MSFHNVFLYLGMQNCHSTMWCLHFGIQKCKSTACCLTCWNPEVSVYCVRFTLGIPWMSLYYVLFTFGLQKKNCVTCWANSRCVLLQLRVQESNCAADVLNVAIQKSCLQSTFTFSACTEFTRILHAKFF